MRAFQLPIRSADREKHRRRRCGFTLVELILALAVMITLLVALYAAFDVYARLSTVGREGVQRARLARAILRKMQSDLHSLVYQPQSGAPAGAAAPTTSGSSSSGSSTSGQQLSTTGQGSGAGGISSSTTSLSLSISTSTPVASGHQGLVGDPTTLMIYVNRPRNPAEQLYAPLEGVQGQLQSVSWFLATANAGGLQGAVGNLAAGGSVYTSRETGSQGLTRLAGDPAILSQADAQGDLQTMANYAEVIAGEVNLLQFRYFDGAQWLDTWDSAALGGLPRAVEITLGFRRSEDTPQPANNPLATLGLEEVSTTYRLVVALPISPPQVTTTTTY